MCHLRGLTLFILIHGLFLSDLLAISPHCAFRQGPKALLERLSVRAHPCLLLSLHRLILLLRRRLRRWLPELARHRLVHAVLYVGPC